MNKKPEKQNQITAKSKTVPKYSAIAEHHCERKKKTRRETLRESLQFQTK